jgi:hypothetical protein
MVTERFKEIHPGNRPLLSAGEMNRANRLLEGMTNLSAFGGAQATFDPAAGFTVSHITQLQWGKITGKDGSTPPKYSWQAMQDLGNGTFAPQDPPLTGSATAGMWAQEQSGNTGVATDGTVIVELKAANGTFWWFQATASSIAKQIRFHLPGTLATTDPSKANCPVDYYWQGANPGAIVTVWNQPLFDGNYMFQGVTGKTGLASYDDTAAKYWIFQMEC